MPGHGEPTRLKRWYAEKSVWNKTGLPLLKFGLVSDMPLCKTRTRLTRKWQFNEYNLYNFSNKSESISYPLEDSGESDSEVMICSTLKRRLPMVGRLLNVTDSHLRTLSLCVFTVTLVIVSHDMYVFKCVQGLVTIC